MGGSSKTTSASTVPAWVTKAEQDALARTEQASRIGNVGYYGPDVAAMTPSQIAAMQGTNMAASAFGQPTVDVTAGMPTATNYGGMNAYSSGAGYDAALAELKSRFPGQFDAIMSMFVNPVTGAMPGATGATTAGAQHNQSNMSADGVNRSPYYNDQKTGKYIDRPSSSGGYVNLRDMYDGGGPGMSGTTFSGGPVSGKLNAVGVKPAAPMRPPTAPSRPASSSTSSAKSSSTKSSSTKSTGGSNATRR